MKSKTSGIIKHIAPESKIQLVNCELSPYFTLLHSSSLDICAIDAYILWSLSFSPLPHARLPFSLKCTRLRHFLLSFGGLGHFVIMWSSDPHLKQSSWDLRSEDPVCSNLGNALDVDLMITWSQNVPSHQKVMRNGEGKYVLMKKVIMHATTAKIVMTIRYTHLWHECLAMTNTKVKSMVTVCNWPIGFWIQEQRAIWRRKLRISFQDHYPIRINTLKLRTDITSRRNKKDKYE